MFTIASRVEKFMSWNEICGGGSFISTIGGRESSSFSSFPRLSSGSSTAFLATSTSSKSASSTSWPLTAAVVSSSSSSWTTGGDEEASVSSIFASSFSKTMVVSGVKVSLKSNKPTTNPKANTIMSILNCRLCICIAVYTRKPFP